MSNVPINDNSNEEDDLFYFESDHLALKGNKEYSEMLKTMFILEAQRQQAFKDYNQVIQLKKDCLEDPFGFVEKLKCGSLGVPDMQRIPELPRINWSKYNVKIPEQYIKQLYSDQTEHQVKEQKQNAKEKTSVNPWTTDEQRKLEELLVKYPPEEFNSKRIKKIAMELGTRTDKQVASRLQKYYLKLVKAGLPIPGKLPKSVSYDRRSVVKRLKKSSEYKNYMRPSTFFPELDIPVVMNESEHVPGPSSASNPPEAATAAGPSNYLLINSYHEEKPADVVKNDVDVQLELLKRIKMEKVNEQYLAERPYQHFSYKCDFCETEPIEGSRWHCTACLSDSIDFCTDCMLSQMYSDSPHPIQHKFIIVRNDKVTLNINSDSESISGSSVKNEDSNSECSDQYESEDEKSEPNSDAETPVKQEGYDENSFTPYQYNFEFSENCPSNIFETKSERSAYMNGGNFNDAFTETQNVAYDYLHSNLLMEDS